MKEPVVIYANRIEAGQVLAIGLEEYADRQSMPRAYFRKVRLA